MHPCLRASKVREIRIEYALLHVPKAESLNPCPQCKQVLAGPEADMEEMSDPLILTVNYICWA